MCLFPKNINGRLVSCGTCPECIKRRVNDYKQRAYAEFNSSECALFFTLTYDNEHLPISEHGISYPRYKDIQAFFKRFRHHVPTSSFRYMVVSEFGTDKFRPHWHGILFFKIPRNLLECALHHNPPARSYDKSWSKSMNSFIESIWQNGIVRFSFCRSQAAVGYCVKYMDLQHNLSVDSLDFLDKNKSSFPRRSVAYKEFVRFHRTKVRNSKSFGIDYVTDSRKAYFNTTLMPVLNINGYHYSMCRYYKDKFFSRGVKAIISRRSEDFMLSKNLSLLSRAAKDCRIFSDFKLSRYCYRPIDSVIIKRFIELSKDDFRYRIRKCASFVNDLSHHFEKSRSWTLSLVVP